MKSQTFGELIRNTRIKNRLTLRHVANKADIDQSTLSKIERNELVALNRIIKPLAEVLNLDYKALQIKLLSEKLFYELKGKDFAIEAIEQAKRRLEIEKKGMSYELERKQLIERIQDYLQAKPIEKAWIFGSFARKQEGIDSDVDLLVRFEIPNKLDLFDYAGIKIDLEDITGRQVDLVEEGYVIPNATKKIEQDKVLIYEREAR